MVSMKLARIKDLELEYGKYLEFINAANKDNDDWVRFDSIESLKTFLFSSRNYDASRHFAILADKAIVADVFVKIHDLKPSVAEIELNICMNWRNKGLGEKLLSKALNLLSESVSTIRIILSPGNREVLPYAKAKGFSVLTQVDLEHDLKLLSPFYVPSGYQIQPAGVSQLEEVTLLRNKIFDTVHRVEELETAIKSEVISTNILVAITNGAIVGYCIAQKERRTSSREGWIVEIGVKLKHRRKGLGKAMLLMNLNWLKSSGCNRATVNCKSDNASALKLYEEIGFKIFRVKEKILEKRKIPRNN